MTMPAQKPGRSEQQVGTPENFLAAARQRLGIRQFAIDLAAGHDAIAVVNPYFDEETNSLIQPWWEYCNARKGWGWLNPPFEKIEPWAEKCWTESRLGAMVALLVPAAVGANWWIRHVRGKGYVTYLQGRITFIGHAQGYPKDLALVLYAPFLEGGSCTWQWNPPKRRS